MQVVIMPEVIEYFDNLVDVLFENNYFGFAEDAIEYVDELRHQIKTTLPTKLHKPAPKYFDRYGKGMKYAGFRKNKQTTWYVFFKTYIQDGKIIYVVRYIANNHVIAQYL